MGSFVLLIKMATSLHCILFAICLLLVNLALAQQQRGRQRQVIRVRGRPRSQARAFSPVPVAPLVSSCPKPVGLQLYPDPTTLTDFSSVPMVHLLMKPVEMGFYSTNLRHLLALRITIALIIGKQIVIKDQLKIILLLRQVVLISLAFSLWTMDAIPNMSSVLLELPMLFPVTSD